MFIRIIKLSIFFIGLFTNDILFGMISSSNQQLKEDHIKEIAKIHGFVNTLNLRSASKFYKQLFNYVFDDLFDNTISPNYVEKDISSSCAYVHSIYSGNHNAVKWFHTHKLYYTLCAIKQFKNTFYGEPMTNYNYYSIYLPNLIKDSDSNMKQLFNNYNIKDFYSDILKNQESYNGIEYLKKDFDDWDIASETLDIQNNPINPLSIWSSEKKSAKDFYADILNNSVYHKIDNELIMLACTKDIENFKQLTSNLNKKLNKTNVCLITIITLKNKDLNFLKYLLKNDSFAQYIQKDQSLLSFIFLNSVIEYACRFSSPKINISPEHRFSNNHIKWIETLIKENIFTEIPEIIQNNKDSNQVIKKIYNLLKIQLKKQKQQNVLVNQNVRIKKNQEDCLIQ